MACLDDKQVMQLTIRLIIGLLLSTSALHAEVFTHQYERNKSEKIQMVLVDGMNISESCSKNIKSCWKYFNQKIKNSHVKTKLKGHPASIFCSEVNGISLIVRDSKNNEYDFCKFETDFYVDSWDLLERRNK
jgi:hypothetical protein